MKIHGGERTFMKRNDTRAILVAYSFVLIRAHYSQPKDEATFMKASSRPLALAKAETTEW